MAEVKGLLRQAKDLVKFIPLTAGATLEIKAEAKKVMEDAQYFEDPYVTAEGADVLVLMTEWNEYRALDFEKLGARMRGKVFIDLKGVYQPAKLRWNGFD